MKFVPVKGARPEVCQHPDASDPAHMPDECIFQTLEVRQMGKVSKGDMTKELTKEPVLKYRWTGPAFNEPELTGGDGARKCKVLTAPRQGRNR